MRAAPPPAVRPAEETTVVVVQRRPTTPGVGAVGDQRRRPRRPGRQRPRTCPAWLCACPAWR
ncbi:MAG: hypothetical protein WDN06_09720 [Asticcacaulis sp.]